MSKTINVRIEDEDHDMMRKSGMSISEYTRQAIHNFSVKKHNSLIRHDMDVVQNCIDCLVGMKKELKTGLIEESYKTLYEIEKNVKKNDEKTLYKNEENVKKLYDNDENVIQDVIHSEEDLSYKNNENVKTMSEDIHYPQIKNHLQTLSKMINIHGSVPKHTKTMISEKTTLTPTQVNDFLVLHHEEIKQIPYELDGVHYTSMPSERKYKG